MANIFDLGDAMGPAKVVHVSELFVANSQFLQRSLKELAFRDAPERSPLRVLGPRA